MNHVTSQLQISPNNQYLDNLAIRNNNSNLNQETNPFDIDREYDSQYGRFDDKNKELSKK